MPQTLAFAELAMALCSPLQLKIYRFMDQSVALSQTLRITRRLLAQVLLVCLSAAAADAATHTQRHGVARRHASALSSSAVVHAQTSPSCGTGLTLRTLQRQSRTVAGPV